MKQNTFNMAIDETSDLLRFLSHPLRLTLLCLLCNGPQNVSTLQEQTMASQVRVSQFLLMMKNKGILNAKREGAFVYYEIKDSRIKTLINALHKIFCAEKPKRGKK